MNPQIGWALAALALAAGYFSYGWRGVVLGLTVIVFWLLLQFSRALRAMRDAGSAPKGQVPSAVMLNAQLKAGMTLIDVLKRTRSLGLPQAPVAPADEAFLWADAGGVSVLVNLRGGKVTDWQLMRPADAAG
ncbi:hypothetical protein [Methylibium rhizosphaerae]|uniref:hypothetical protein n=1 Tax=Methylibium rhizosphaerae TaxID=2570323 RepID=UPI00112DE8CC|nr:hypothetical protein [Methylibium rhizosphaerae]